jgi:hypothetical protein
MLKRFLLITALIIIIVFVYDSSFAQCAMCKATAESGKDDAAKGLNYAIMYLLLIPYILIAAIGYWWYVRNKKKGKEGRTEV